MGLTACHVQTFVTKSECGKGETRIVLALKEAKIKYPSIQALRFDRFKNKLDLDDI